MPDVLCFDVFGSTHDQHSTPVRRLMEVAGVSQSVAQQVSHLWADEQLRYSFELTMMDRYETWWSLADSALTFALDSYGLDVTDEDHERILEAYNYLEPYESWAPFEQLSERYDLYILSDGNPDMLESVAQNTGFDEYLSGIVSAHAVRGYKPRPEVYQQMESIVDGDLAACELVATHQFDVAGAMNAGMDGTFVNRFGEPPGRLGFTPTRTVNSYSELAEILC